MGITVIEYTLDITCTGLYYISLDIVYDTRVVWDTGVSDKLSVDFDIVEPIKMTRASDTRVNIPITYVQ